ncbi:MAG: DUF721 domain-containing protein [Tenuifilaceae bacterium]
MSNHNIQSLGDALNEFIRENKLEEKIYETKIINDWKKIMGHNVSVLTQSITLKNGRLVLTLKSSVLRNELNMSKQKIIVLVNSYFGKNIVKEVFCK